MREIVVTVANRQGDHQGFAVALHVAGAWNLFQFPLDLLGDLAQGRQVIPKDIDRDSCGRAREDQR